MWDVEQWRGYKSTISQPLVQSLAAENLKKKCSSQFCLKTTKETKQKIPFIILSLLVMKFGYISIAYFFQDNHNDKVELSQSVFQSSKSSSVSRTGWRKLISTVVDSVYLSPLRCFVVHLSLPLHIVVPAVTPYLRDRKGLWSVYLFQCPCRSLLFNSA